MNYRSTRAFDRREIELVTDVAERTWAAVERARAETALRDSQARLAAAFASVPVGVAVIDVERRAMLLNAEYRHYLPTGLIPSRDPPHVARWRAWDAAGRPIDVPIATIAGEKA